jgi:hypothetical protein
MLRHAVPLLGRWWVACRGVFQPSCQCACGRRFGTLNDQDGSEKATTLFARVLDAVAVIEQRRGIAAARLEARRLAVLLEDPECWTRAPEQAQTHAQAQAQLLKRITPLDEVRQRAHEARDLLALATGAGDAEVRAEQHAVLQLCWAACQGLLLESLLNRPHDAYDCVLEVAAGAGGDDAHDCSMLSPFFFSSFFLSNAY